MTDIPALMSAPMVRALLDGRKTQTRRLAWRSDSTNKIGIFAPTIWQSVKPGDRIWVRETMKVGNQTLVYVADNADVPKGSFAWQDWYYQYGERSVPSIHMPRWASRLTLLVTATRMERLREISEEDARAEGIRRVRDGGGTFAGREGPRNLVTPWYTAHEAFCDLWQSLHTKPGARWEDDPTVVALSFKPYQCNIEGMG